MLTVFRHYWYHYHPQPWFCCLATDKLRNVINVQQTGVSMQRGITQTQQCCTVLMVLSKRFAVFTDGNWWNLHYHIFLFIFICIWVVFHTTKEITSSTGHSRSLGFLFPVSPFYKKKRNRFQWEHELWVMVPCHIITGSTNNPAYNYIGYFLLCWWVVVMSTPSK